jgi:hypothetical protein
VTCWKFFAAQPIHARITDVAHRYLVVVEHRYDQSGTHPGILRLALRRLVDGAIYTGHFSLEGDLCPGFSRRIDTAGFAFKESTIQFRAKQRRRHAARHFSGVVAAHAIGQNNKPAHGIGHDGVFIVRAHHARIAAGDNFQNGAHVHGHALKN